MSDNARSHEMEAAKAKKDIADKLNTIETEEEESVEEDTGELLRLEEIQTTAV